MTTPDPLGRYHGWIVQAALPRWATDGFDASGVRFRERLDTAAAPLDLPHRAMVQARQIFTFAEAERRGWHHGGGRLAEWAMASLIDRYLDEEGDRASFAFSADEAGRIVSATRDAYTHAFALFAIAGLYRLNGDPRLLNIADKVIRYLDEALTDPVHGGLFDAIPRPHEDKRQNPHMHLLEAYLFLDGAAPGRGYLERAGRIVELFATRLFDRAHGCLLEYFAADWSHHPDPARGTLWEPGHHFEWVWLLHEYARASGTAVEHWTEVLYDHALHHGVAANGRVIDEASSVDKAVTRASSRVWPHTEAIKAAASRHAAGDAQARPFAARMATALLDGFLDRPFAGGWVDHLAPDGAALVDYVPASSLYHLFLAAAVSADTFGTAAARAPQPA